MEDEDRGRADEEDDADEAAEVDEEAESKEAHKLGERRGWDF